MTAALDAVEWVGASEYREARHPALDRCRFEAVKEAVPVPTMAEDLSGKLHKVGLRWRGKCALCGHGSNSGAFSASERLWTCFACGEGGDVVTLAALALDMPPAMAASWIAERYGIEIPQHPPSWYERHDEKARVREAAEKHIARVYQRRLTRLYSPLVLVGGESPEEELRELEELARSLWPVARAWADRRVNGEG